METEMVRFHYRDYTVAWICALPLEMAAAEAMLDERHDSLPTRANDSNTYTLGSIYAHNVVIACLPSGVYGTTSAATVASQLQFTSKSIRFGLMVGIGGGAPSKKADIRLGDVVVSKPTRDLGGVVQYDYGKTVRGGHFERTGALNKPPAVLLTAISKLQAAYMSGLSKIPALLSEMTTRNPTMKQRFTYRGKDQDLLFDTEYDHCGSESTCDDCDKGKLATRPDRVGHEPVIHYGLIASGNQVIKHSGTRDKLAQELGILCFEMEAAGLMDNFPCLVIRGICDYSDSHKNKQWQEYAAATAAAYAKELLSVVHTSQVVETPSANSVTEISYYNRHIPSWVQDPTSSIVHQDYGQDDEKLLEKISSYDHQRIHRRLFRKRLTGTTQWFFDHPDFKQWFVEKKISTLWCSGKIGSGKTMIAAAVIEAAKYRSSNAVSPTVFFYCDNEHHGKLDVSYILSSFIKQLYEFLQLTFRVPEDIAKDIRRFFGHKRTQPDFDDLKDIFTNLFHHIPDTIYVIDGLDALDERHAKTLLKFIRSLFCDSLPPQGTRLLLLSREQVPGHINITTLIPGTRRILTSSNVMRDIETYIETTIAEKMMFITLTDDPQVMEEIKQVLLKESSGMFLWVYLQLEILWDTCSTDAEIRSALGTLPKDLEETYCRCVERMNLSNSHVLKVLKWVSFATRPLHIEELREAVAFNLDDTMWDAGRIPQKDFVIGCCSNLVVMDRIDNCVRFAHSSVRQFLEKGREKPLEERCIQGYPPTTQGDLECGELCVAYLSFSNFGLQLSKPLNEVATVTIPKPVLFAREVLGFGPGSRLLRLTGSQKNTSHLPIRKIRTVSSPDQSQYKFLDYAVTNWAFQTKQIYSESPVWEKFERLATCFNETWNFHPWIPSGRSYLSHLHGLFGWAVKEQHRPLLSIAQAAGPDLRRVCDLPLIGENLTALQLASKLGYESIVQVLIDFCKVNLADRNRYTALHHAASNGHVEICRLLSCAKGVNVDALSEDRCTPLWLAACNGHDEVVSFLLNNKADIEATSSHFRQTPLSRAAQNGHYVVVELLLRNGADLMSEGLGRRIPLWFAAENGHITVVKLLLRNASKIDRERIDELPRTALHLAAENGHKAMVNLLLDMGSDPNKEDVDGEIPLHVASEKGHTAVVKLLLERGSIWNPPSRSLKTPLHLAAENGHIDVVKLLLEKGSDPNLQDNSGQTPLHGAAGNGYIEVVKLLLERGSDSNLKDNSGRTPLKLAYGDKEVENLLKEGAKNGLPVF